MSNFLYHAAKAMLLTGTFVDFDLWALLVMDHTTAAFPEIVGPDPLARREGETRRANAAVRDYAALGSWRGSVRSLRELHAHYVEQAAHGDVVKPPTTVWRTLTTWRRRHDWDVRITAQGYAYSLADFKCLDEFDGPNYSRLPLSQKSVDANLTFRAADLTWPALLPGSRPVVGVVIYRRGVNDADSIPFVFIDKGMVGSTNPFVFIDKGMVGSTKEQRRAAKAINSVTNFPFIPHNSNVTMAWNRCGIIQGRIG